MRWLALGATLAVCFPGALLCPQPMSAKVLYALESSRLGEGSEAVDGRQRPNDERKRTAAVDGGAAAERSAAAEHGRVGAMCLLLFGPMFRVGVRRETVERNGFFAVLFFPFLFQPSKEKSTEMR